MNLIQIHESYRVVELRVWLRPWSARRPTWDKTWRKYSLGFINNWDARTAQGQQQVSCVCVCVCERDYIYTVQTGAFTGGLGDKGLENNSLLSAGVPWKEQVRKYPLHCFYCVYLTPGSGGGWEGEEERVRRRMGRTRWEAWSLKYQKSQEWREKEHLAKDEREGDGEGEWEREREQLCSHTAFLMRNALKTIKRRRQKVVVLVVILVQGTALSICSLAYNITVCDHVIWSASKMSSMINSDYRLDHLEEWFPKLKAGPTTVERA